VVVRETIEGYHLKRRSTARCSSGVELVGNLKAASLMRLRAKVGNTIDELEA
jgi:hypothetical protein